MAKKRIGMKKIRELIRLKSTTEMSDRQIARALNVSRPMVAKYWLMINTIRTRGPYSVNNDLDFFVDLTTK